MLVLVPFTESITLWKPFNTELRNCSKKTELRRTEIQDSKSKAETALHSRWNTPLQKVTVMWLRDIVRTGQLNSRRLIYSHVWRCIQCKFYSAVNLRKQNIQYFEHNLSQGECISKFSVWVKEVDHCYLELDQYCNLYEIVISIPHILDFIEYNSDIVAAYDRTASSCWHWSAIIVYISKAHSAPINSWSTIHLLSLWPVRFWQ